MSDAVAHAASALFVPGDRPDRFSRATATGADIVIIDLEDAVATAHKGAARTAAAQALDEGAHVVVRVNPCGSAAHEKDIAAIAGVRGPGLLGVMVPKADESTPWAELRAAIGVGPAIIALIETARGCRSAHTVAEHPSVDRLAFGALDFAADIGTDSKRVTDFARAGLVIASRAADKPAPLDSPSPVLDDSTAVRRAARRARRDGFGGMLCIHPNQVQVVSLAFQPTPRELAWAQRVVDAPSGATRIDGEMIDAPVVARAARILAHAGAST